MGSQNLGKDIEVDQEGTLLFPLTPDHVIVERDDGNHEVPAQDDNQTKNRRLKSNSDVSKPRGSGNFKITFKYLSDMSSDQRNAFEYAAKRLGRIITSKLRTIASTSNLRCSSVPDEPLPSEIEDLFIFVRITSIDGISGVLGQAGPCLIDGDGFPRVGYVEFDKADVNKMIRDETFDAVCVHEIAHIIGLGTLWDRKGLVTSSTTDPRYTGTHGISALLQIKGDFMGTPAVQDTGGQGTARSHWREKSFGPEMMTAFLSASYQPLSALSVEAFRDLGYTVDSSAADDFQVSSNGYNGGNNFPLPGETFVQPNWFNWDADSFWNSTTIWIVGCVGVGVIVIILSCIYSRIKARRNARPALRSTPPTAMSSLPNNNNNNGVPHRFSVPNPPLTRSPSNNYSNVPTAVEVRTNNPRQATMNPPVAVPVAYPTVPGRSAPITESAIRTVMDVTNCGDRQLAYWYLREANGDVGLAIERYLQRNDRRSLAIT